MFWENLRLEGAYGLSDLLVECNPTSIMNKSSWPRKEKMFEELGTLNLTEHKKVTMTFVWKKENVDLIPCLMITYPLIT